ERRIAHASDFKCAVFGVGRGELQRKLRHLFLQELDRGVGQYMGMDVDGSHDCFLAARRVVRIIAGAAQAIRAAKETSRNLSLSRSRMTAPGLSRTATLSASTLRASNSSPLSGRATSMRWTRCGRMRATPRSSGR